MDAIDKINHILVKRGLTGADLERMIGVSNSVYSQWNTKSTKPSNKSLLKVADALGVEIADIAPDSPVENSYSKQKEKSPAPEGAELIPNYSKLSDTNKAIVDSMIAQLLAAQSEG